MSTVYILFSTKINKFYIGFTTTALEERLQKHNHEYYENKFTAKGIPWEVYLEIKCNANNQARKIETFTKKMKSKNFILNLKEHGYQFLLEKFSDC